MRGIIQLLVLLSATYHASAVIKNEGWWKNTVFDQIYPRSFMDSNDGGFGNLKEITDKLGQFVETGNGLLWLSPLYPIRAVNFGYDISDFKDIDPNFGTMEDFEKLTAKAKSLGIKVILDPVPNHTSDELEWFRKSLTGSGKYKDYYIWKTGKKNDNVPSSTSQFGEGLF